MKKRSISIQGHRTSYSLEDAFQAELQKIAGQEGISVARLIARIDRERSRGINLSSALRLHVLEYLKQQRG
ncbi:ribbon-helix-helix domain-containing protein [Salaquimonas pukyongi]|uniref:ribbon-helix-helix domain-containing protein n=1 Tax=Salaquimonas pukyongi TaxID=2712698 RepID=UPI00096B7073|nr:ribbon-helix-helix domain-containing protein [Salaquimonas pukyongi]